MEELRARLEAELSRLSSATDVPGASLAVAVGEQLVQVTAGIVNTRTRVPVTVDTLFPIQSVTKVFTATLVMQLVDDELVRLDDPVRAHLPAFHTSDRSASERITVRHLLTHTGGFEGDLWQPASAAPEALERFVQDVVTSAPQHSHPGARYSYCSAGFGVLGRLVEVLRGTSYEQALRHHIAEPLGIHELAFSADQALAYRTAIGHVRPTSEAALQPTRSWTLLPPSNPAAGNQLAMSARGLIALARVFTAGGCAPGGSRLLTPESAALMLTPQLLQRASPAVPVEQGLGWYLPRTGMVEHAGGAPGVAAVLKIVPERQVAVALLTNAEAGARLAREVLDPVLHELAGLTPQRPPSTPDPFAVIAEPAPVLGHYANRQTRYTISTDDAGRLRMIREPQNETISIGQLAGAPSTGDSHEIRPLGDDTFAVIGEDGRPHSTVAFLERTENGRFQLLAADRVASRTN